ncbi:MAG: AMP-binding protein [Actinobacteria bacterium]|nr:AMP-binding protein [Actinomycetota bacterium]
MGRVGLVERTGVSAPTWDRHEPGKEALRAWSLHLGGEVSSGGALRDRLSSGPTLSDAFDEVARMHGGRPALSIAGRRLTHSEVAERSVRVAGSLHKLGVAAGTRVMVVADVDLDVVLAYLAALRLGAVTSLAHPGYTTGEIGRLVAVGRSDVQVP